MKPSTRKMKDSGVPWIGEIPDEWEVKRSKVLFRETNLRSTTGQEELLTVSHLTGVTTRKSKDVYMFLPESFVDYKTCSKNDLVINTMWAWMGALGFAWEDGIVSPSYNVYRLRNNQTASPGYYDALFRTPAFVKEVIRHSKGVWTSRLRLYPESFFEIRVPIPPLRLQRTIAAFLDRKCGQIDGLIEKKERLIALLKEQRQAIISQAVTKGLDPHAKMKDSGIPWIGEIPQHWETKRLKRMFRSTKRQNQPPQEILSVYREYGVIKKSSRDDNFNKTPEDISSYQLVEASDLVINKMKAWQGSLGISEFRGLTSPDYIVYSPTHHEDDRFIHYFLRAYQMKDVYLSISNGIRPSQWRVIPEEFEHLPICLPPFEEQRKIGERLHNLDRTIDRLLNENQIFIEKLKEYRQALISAAVTGKIDVPEELDHDD